MDAFVPSEDGRWVSERFERLARVVEDYDPQFELRWIPPEHRTDPEDVSKCFAVFDVLTNTPVFFAGELDTPESILARLFDSDNKHGNVLERIDVHNAAVRALELKKEMDEAEERQERVAWYLKAAHKKNYIEMGKGRVLDDNLRVVRRGR